MSVQVVSQPWVPHIYECFNKAALPVWIDDTKPPKTTDQQATVARMFLTEQVNLDGIIFFHLSTGNLICKVAGITSKIKAKKGKHQGKTNTVKLSPGPCVCSDTNPTLKGLKCSR
jgi:hypothetical protein